MSLFIAFLILVTLLLIGVPVPFSFGGATIYLAMINGASPFALFSTSYTQVSPVTLMAIPLFIIAGGIMEKGQIGKALIDWVSIFVGHLKGGMAIVTSVTCAIFGAICGTGAATLSCIGSIVAPQMKARKYPVHMSAAVACCSAPLGMLIPPSSMMILVSWLMNSSVLAGMLATIVPGIILCILLCIVSTIMLRNNHDIVLEETYETRKEWGEAVKKRTFGALPALFMPLLILGGIYGGVMTPAESAAVAAVYAVPVAMFIYKKVNLKTLGTTLRDTVCTAGVCMCMVAIVVMLCRIITESGIPQMVMTGVLSVTDNKYIILLLVNILLIILGMIMDDTSAALLAVPILYPMMQAIGVNTYQFAALAVINIGMGNITPPTAPFLYLTARIFKTDATGMIKPVMAYLLFCYLPVLLLVSYVPEVTLWLPRLIMGAKIGL